LSALRHFERGGEFARYRTRSSGAGAGSLPVAAWRYARLTPTDASL